MTQPPSDHICEVTSETFQTEQAQRLLGQPPPPPPATPTLAEQIKQLLAQHAAGKQ